jgi:hypothetical protein
MTAGTITVIAAIIAAITSIATLLLNSRLTIRREKRMMLWEKELERLLELEENAGKVQEIALSYSSNEVMESEFKPLHDWLRHAAGRFGRYPALAIAIRNLNHACAVTVACKVSGKDYSEWSAKIPAAFLALITICDRITERETVGTLIEQFSSRMRQALERER